MSVKVRFDGETRDSSTESCANGRKVKTKEKKEEKWRTKERKGVVEVELAIT